MEQSPGEHQATVPSPSTQAACPLPHRRMSTGITATTRRLAWSSAHPLATITIGVNSLKVHQNKMMFFYKVMTNPINQTRPTQTLIFSGTYVSLTMITRQQKRRCPGFMPAREG
ncbi:hypothetical protein [Commensalibacter sp. ESL0382]|uniref:hypothetical protein n=1 Tax=Commensalibacter sp. ESL0382 TaxID=2676445 RepID=UPI001E57EBD7|nr:hypothetical protein [Commensalibacter sp. ESL0382]